jgi:hypothetical protein
MKLKLFILTILLICGIGFVSVNPIISNNNIDIQQDRIEQSLLNRISNKAIEDFKSNKINDDIAVNKVINEFPIKLDTSENIGLIISLKEQYNQSIDLLKQEENINKKKNHRRN